ncbi:uncharacterized protein LOC123710584 [Pieris brassicae]|uniref:Uncharacterized protein n=1 Tax=Pieris brassicae TaxID=7116 RepID=A0A9P0TG33_PIEBR|nr:uncharacterized protein LOC123710584 [Pieris brassicae]CAH4031696.1 unnamed protein product [Pieris brassicae]
MMSKFSKSLEAIPRQRSFACLSLKFGSLFSGLAIILYSILALAQCIVAFSHLPKEFTSDDFNIVFTYAVLIGVTFTHALTLFLSAILLVGIIREKLPLMKPWIVWTSIQVIMSVIMFVLWTTFSLVNHEGSGSLLLYVIEFLALMIRFYMLMIVASFYKQVEETGGETERLKNINIDSWYTV